MMKLFISYYDDYISIVEGEYKLKKGQYHIKSTKLFSIHDIDDEYKNEKYGLLKYVLLNNSFKTKDVVFSLNTKDIVLKSYRAPKVSKKDLEGIMGLEIEEIMSLDETGYVFSYEVVKENNKSLEDDLEFLDLIVGAIRKEEIEMIISIFEDFKLNICRIDTLTTSYLRILKSFEHEDIMVANVGDGGTIVNIYKQNSLFIYDNIPIKISIEDMEIQLESIAKEAKGLMDYYSSRNFGKSVETILILGNRYNNKLVYQEFSDVFSNEISRGITEITDIEKVIIGDIEFEDINLIVENLGSMIENCDKKGYDNINFLTKELKNKQYRREKLRKVVKNIPFVMLICLVPYIGTLLMENHYKDELGDVQNEITKLQPQYNKAKDMEEKIALKEKEIKIYDMLMGKEVKWGEILSAIDKATPMRLDLTSMSTYYDLKSIEEDESNSSSENKSNQNSNSYKKDNTQSDDNNLSDSQNEGTEEQEPKVEIYNQVPKLFKIEGESKSSSYVGKFLYNLKIMPYFKEVNLHKIEENKEEGIYNFSMTLYLKEGVLTNE